MRALLGKQSKLRHLTHSGSIFSHGTADVEKLELLFALRMTQVLHKPWRVMGRDLIAMVIPALSASVCAFVVLE